jgi:hypothetical protein
MIRFNSLIAQDAKLIKYSKKIIGCAFVIACVTSSASAMLPRAAKALNRTGLATTFSHHSYLSTFADGLNINKKQFSSIEYNDKAKLNEIEQRNVVIRELLGNLPKNQIKSILEKLPSKGVGADAISVVQRLYAEIETPLDIAPTRDNHPTFPQSVTGC